MIKYKTFDEILSTPWDGHRFEPSIRIDSNSPRYEWDYSRKMKIEDVRIWEEIFYREGSISVYAAWNPHAEFYIICYNLHMGLHPAGIESFYGPGASKKIENKLQSLGIVLPKNSYWVPLQDLWLHNN